MTHSSDYTITTVSSSITQHNTSNSQPAPFRFGGPHGPLNIRSTCLPYAPTQNPDSSFVFSQVNCTGTSPAPSPPSPTDTVYYTQVLSASNLNGTSSFHVGSLYLDARTYSTIGVLANELKYGSDGNVFVELKRFTNSVTLTTLSGPGASGYQYLTASSVSVSTADWYDIYISSSSPEGNDTTSSIRGVYYDL